MTNSSFTRCGSLMDACGPTKNRQIRVIISWHISTMPTIRVYRFQKYASSLGVYVISTRMATREQIERVGAEIMPGTEADIDGHFVNADGWTERNFDPFAAPAAMTPKR